MKIYIEEYCKANGLINVVFHEQVPVGNALEYMYASDVGLVSISRGVSDVAYPSKSIMYLSTGLPVLAVIDKHSELFDMVNNESLGVAVAPTEEEIKQGIEKVASNISNRAYSREHICKFAESSFSKNKILNELSDLIMENHDER